MDLVGGEARRAVSCKQVREEHEQALVRGVPAEFAEMGMIATNRTAGELMHPPLEPRMRLGNREQAIDRDRAHRSPFERDGARAVPPAAETLHTGNLAWQGESDDLLGAVSVIMLVRNAPLRTV